VARWVDANTHGWTYRPASDRDWGRLVDQCGGGPPFEAVLSVARRNRCRTVVVENRYVDADYRSDYSAFWSKRFDSIPPFARRVHFFRATLADDRLHQLPSRPGYLGYSVLRPGPHADGRVGRTLLVPPPQLRSATMATVPDEVSLFGNRLSVEGAPFSEQDGEFLRCAHAAIWACHYSAYRRELVGRRLTADLVELTPALLSAARALPSPGMTLEQIQAVFDATGQPALLYALSHLPRVPGVEEASPKQDPQGKRLAAGYWDIRLFSVICRYLNSGFPVMIANATHAWVLVGWFRRNGRIRFVACDDQQGPYEVIESPFTDHRAPWLAIMVPLPPKVYMSGEMAETWGHQSFRAFGFSAGAPPSWHALARALATTPKGVSLRTFLRDGRDYKAGVQLQGRDPAVTRALRLARLPHYVWVVEAHDRRLRDAGKPSVLAEVVFDTNSSDHIHREPRRDALSMPGLLVVTPPDDGNPVGVLCRDRPWRSHLSDTVRRHV
jgi:hypothetical protein